MKKTKAEAVDAAANLSTGETLLAIVAKDAADSRDAISLRKKDEVTERLIVLAETNENAVRASAFSKVAFRMLIKASRKVLGEMKKENLDFDDLVTNLEEVKEEKEDDLQFEEKAAEETKAEEKEEEKEEKEEEKEEVEDKEKKKESEQEKPEKIEEIPIIRPDTTASSFSNRPLTAPLFNDADSQNGNPYHGTPRISWTGNGQNLVDRIYELAERAAKDKKTEEEEEKAGDPQHDDHNNHGDKKKKKGKKGKDRKEEKKNKRRAHREEVHGLKLEDVIKKETIGLGGLDVLASSKNARLGLNFAAEGRVGFSVAGKGGEREMK